MMKTLMLALALLLSATWLQAQTQQDQGSQDRTTQSSQSSYGQGGADTSGQKTVEGCLQGAKGNYTLTDDSGMTYRLQGNDSEISKHNGHEVQITGSVSGPNSGTASSAMPSGGTNAAPTLTVDNLKHIAKTCKSAMSK